METIKKTGRGGARPGAGRKKADPSQEKETTTPRTASLYDWEYEAIVAAHGSFTDAVRKLVPVKARQARKRHLAGR